MDSSGQRGNRNNCIQSEAMRKSSLHNTRNGCRWTSVALWAALFLVVVLETIELSIAFPTQAGSCEGGMPAVEGSHKANDGDKTIVTGPLADGNYTIDIDRKITLAPSSDVENPSIVLKSGVDYFLRIAAKRKRYKGFLIRLEAPGSTADVSMALIPSVDAQIAAVCYEPVVGVCHFDNELKNFAGATLRIDDPSVVLLDITVVQENTNKSSSYFYSRYTVRFEKEPSPVAPAVTPSVPIASSPAPSVDAPSAGKVPIAAPVAAPSIPSVPTVLSPVTAPSVTAPTSGQGPIASPLAAPYTPATSQPTTVPSTSTPTVGQRPVSAPMAPSIVTPTVPASDNCIEIASAYEACAAANFREGQKEECQNCATMSVPSGVSDCASYQSSVCKALETCDCGSCVGFLVGYLDCLLFVGPGIDCTLGCDFAVIPSVSPSVNPSVGPSVNPSVSPFVSPVSVNPSVSPFVSPVVQSSNPVAPSPTEAGECDISLTTARDNCFRTEITDADAKECSACIQSALKEKKNRTGTDFADDDCSDLEVYTCGILGNCEKCASCNDELESLLNCTVAGKHGCSLDCSVSISPVAAPSVPTASSPIAVPSVATPTPSQGPIAAPITPSSVPTATSPVAAPSVNSPTSSQGPVTSPIAAPSAPIAAPSAPVVAPSVPTASSPIAVPSVATPTPSQGPIAAPITPPSVPTATSPVAAPSANSPTSSQGPVTSPIAAPSAPIAAPSSASSPVVAPSAVPVPGQGPAAAPSASISPVSSPTGAKKCDVSLTTARDDCFRTELTEVDAKECSACIQTALKEKKNRTGTNFGDDDCNYLEAYTCDSLMNCKKCGSCVDELESLLDCTLAGKYGCSLNCSASASPVSPPVTSPLALPTVPAESLFPSVATPTSSYFPSAAPYTSSSPVAAPSVETPTFVCDSSLTVARDDCFRKEISKKDAEECSTCIQSALKDKKDRTGSDFADDSCEDLGVYICDVLSDCKSCGCCVDELESLLDCTLAGKYGCNLDCSRSLPPASSETPFAAPITIPTSSQMPMAVPSIAVPTAPSPTALSPVTTTTPGPATTAPSANVPTPTDLFNQFLLSLPTMTRDAVAVQSTAQNMAFQWLKSDTYLLTQDQDPLFRMTQRFALATLYYATNGSQWVDSRDWLNESLHECNWFGCSCIDNSIQSLTLEANNLSGMLPPEISLLSLSLETLLLGDNSQKLTGPIATEFGKLSKLTVLDLSYNNFVGPIPTALGDLSNLEKLQLAVNLLTGTIPSELAMLTKLVHLAVAGNLLSGAIPTSLSELMNLEELLLYENSLMSSIPTELIKLSKLKVLDFSYNFISGTIPTYFGGFANMEALHLRYNALSGWIPELGKLTKLNEILLDSNKLSGTIPTSLQVMGNLSTLSLSKNALTGSIPTELGMLSKLRMLYLAENQLNKHIPTELSRLSDAQILHLHANDLTGTVPEDLGELLWLMELSLDRNQLSGSIPIGICDLVDANALVITIDCDLVKCDCGCSCDALTDEQNSRK